MDLDFNKSSEKDHFYTKLREKYKSEIRKNKNCELFKFKRLAFQLISTTQTSASLSQTQQAIDIALSELNAPNQSSEKIAKQLLFLRKHTSEQPNNLKTTNYLLEIGFGDVLNKFLIDYQNYNIEIHQELLWLVCNLSYLDAKDTPQLKRTDFVDFLKKSLCLKNYKQLEMVFWGLNNLSDDSVECREKIVKEGVVTIIREQILSSNMVNIETLKNYFTLLHSISKGEQDFYFEEILKSLDLILVSLKVDDDEILIHLMVLLSKMSNNPNKNLMRNLLEKLKDEHILQIMVFFEKNSNEISKMSILLLFCNIFAEDDDWVQKLIDLGMLNFYLKVLDNESNINIRQYVCFAISNILACDSVIIKQTMNHAIFNHPIWRDPNEDYQIKKELIYCLTNIMKRGSKEDILKTIKKGYLEIFIENTRLSGSDLIFLMLEAIENTLMTVSEIEEDNQKNIAMGLIRKEGIPEWIISLQEHPDEKIYNLSYKILDKFFDCEENKI